MAPTITDTGLNIQYRAYNAPGYSYMPISSSRGSVSYVTGSHAAKVGFSFVTGRYRIDSFNLGDMRSDDASNSPVRFRFARSL